MITAKIENIVNTLYPGATYALSSDYEANIDNYDINEIDYPFIILDNMLYEDIAIQPNANELERIRILITVLYQDDYEATDKDSNIIIEQAKVILKRIMVNIFQLNEIRETNPVYRIEPIKVKDWNRPISGVVGLANWNYNNVISWCLTNP